MTFVAVSANPSPKNELLKEAVSDNIKSNNIHAFHHIVFSKFQAARGGWFKRYCNKTWIFMPKLEPTPHQILKSDNELGAKECRIKACLKTHFHQDWSTNFFQNLPFETSWHQYSKVVCLSRRYLQSLVAKASSLTNSYFKINEQTSTFQPIKALPKSGEPEV